MPHRRDDGVRRPQDALLQILHRHSENLHFDASKLDGVEDGESGGEPYLGWAIGGMVRMPGPSKAASTRCSSGCAASIARPSELRPTASSSGPLPVRRSYTNWTGPSSRGNVVSWIGSSAGIRAASLARRSATS